MNLIATARAASAALILLFAVPAAASDAPSPFGARSAPRPADGIFSWDRGHRHGFPGIIIVEREVPVIVEREVLVERVPAPPPPAPAAQAVEKRKPYAIGASYASLPGGCMKLIEEGTSYYFCGGREWYRQIGEGSSASYQAVARKL